MSAVKIAATLAQRSIMRRGEPILSVQFATTAVATMPTTFRTAMIVPVCAPEKPLSASAVDRNTTAVNADQKAASTPP